MMLSVERNFQVEPSVLWPWLTCRRRSPLLLEEDERPNEWPNEWRERLLVWAVEWRELRVTRANRRRLSSSSGQAAARQFEPAIGQAGARQFEPASGQVAG